MLIERQIQQYRVLNEWFHSQLGNSVATEFNKVLGPVAKKVKGDTLLQIGDCADNPWLKILNFAHCWVASPVSVATNNRIETALHQLPFPRNSLDCVLAPLSIEPFGGNFSLLDEIDRVLKPMGHIIILSINPWSLWGAASKCGLLGCYDDSKITLITPLHLNRIFTQRGYKQCALKHFGYFPPTNKKSCIPTFPFFDEVGKMLWPFPSNFYCYVAQKYQFITPSFVFQPLGKTVGDYGVPLQPAV